MRTRFARIAIVYAIMPLLAGLIAVTGITPDNPVSEALAQPAPPTLHLNGVQGPVTVYVNEAVSYSYNYTIAEIAIWRSADCAGNPNFIPWTGSDNFFQWVAQGTPQTLWTRARLLDAPSQMSPCYAMTWVARPTATATPTNTPTNTPTETPTNTPTNTPTEVPATATYMPTNTPTQAPATATYTPTNTPTEVPPTATLTPTVTATTEPSATATTTPEPTVTEAPASGTAAITVVTADGDPIPDDTIVCVATQCQHLDDIAAAAAPSGTTATFPDLAPGTYPVSVFVGPTHVYTGSITVAAGETTTLTVTLAAASTGTPGVVGPGTGSGGEAPTDPRAGDDDGADDDSGSDPGTGSGGNGGGSTITTLPSTGAERDAGTPLGAYLVLLGGAALVALSGTVAWRQRRP